jgi:hypothetical protein
MSEWIKCSDEMPLTKKLVLVVVKMEIRPAEFTYCRRIGFYTKGNEIYVPADDCEIPNCELCYKDNHTLDEGWHQEIDDHGTCDSVYDSLSNVTYWMPLPEYPKD